MDTWAERVWRVWEVYTLCNTVQGRYHSWLWIITYCCADDQLGNQVLQTNDDDLWLAMMTLEMWNNGMFQLLKLAIISCSRSDGKDRINRLKSVFPTAHFCALQVLQKGENVCAVCLCAYAVTCVCVCGENYLSISSGTDSFSVMGGTLTPWTIPAQEMMPLGICIMMIMPCKKGKIMQCKWASPHPSSYAAHLNASNSKRTSSRTGLQGISAHYKATMTVLFCRR